MLTRPFPFLTRFSAGAPLLITLSLLLFSPVLQAQPVSERTVPGDPDSPKVREAAAAASAQVGPTVEELQEMLKNLEQQTTAEAVKSQELQQQLFDMRRQARTSDPKALDVQRKIDEMNKQMEQVIDEIPEIKAKTDELAVSKKQVFDLAQERMRIRAKIAAMAQATIIPAEPPVGTSPAAAPEAPAPALE